MPCTDGGARYEPNHRETHLIERNDKLAQRLCQTGALLSSLMRDGKIVGASEIETNQIHRALRHYSEHRKHDQLSAEKNTTNELKQLTDRRRKIMELGGSAGEELQRAILEKTEILRSIQTSNPTNTTLY